MFTSTRSKVKLDGAGQEESYEWTVGAMGRRVVDLERKCVQKCVVGRFHAGVQNLQGLLATRRGEKAVRKACRHLSLMGVDTGRTDVPPPLQGVLYTSDEELRAGFDCFTRPEQRTGGW